MVSKDEARRIAVSYREVAGAVAQFVLLHRGKGIIHVNVSACMKNLLIARLLPPVPALLFLLRHPVYPPGSTASRLGFFGDCSGHAVSTMPGYEPRGGEVLRGVRRTARPDLSALPSRGVQREALLLVVRRAARRP